jgi:hypothetical protein
MLAKSTRVDGLKLVFSGSDEPFSSPLFHYGVWDNFSPRKQCLEKHRSIHEYENKNSILERVHLRSPTCFAAALHDVRNLVVAPHQAFSGRGGI